MGAVGFEPNGNPTVPGRKGQTVKAESVKASVAQCPPMVADAELAALVEAWPTLPAPIKAGILAMLRAAGG